jgi:membrane protein DedA with SNARE-associated domain
MSNGKNIGLALFVIGIILLIGYVLIQGIEEITQALNLITGFIIGLIIIGIIVLIISILIEQRKDTKETMRKIKKEDLKP